MSYPPTALDDGAWACSGLRWYSWCTIGLLGAIILANVLGAVALSGFHAYLPDNPQSYILSGG